MGCIRRRPAQSLFKPDGTALNLRFVAYFDIPARQPRIGAHGAAVFFRRFIIVEHRADDKGRKIAAFRIGHLPQSLDIVIGDFDGGLCHEVIRCRLDG
ncbi:hypothetical protein MnTg02_01693 [bacterium MnTg02]|nr:hypothetical protein MnTg02_01693 [bacterium MnTg02]